MRISESPLVEPHLASVPTVPPQFRASVKWGSAPELVSLLPPTIRLQWRFSRGLNRTKEDGSLSTWIEKGKLFFVEYFSPPALSRREERSVANENEKTLREIEAETVLYLVKDFFAEQKRLRERGISLEAVYDRIADVRQVIDFKTQKIEEDVALQESRIDRHGKEIRKLKEAVFHEENLEDTGSHNVADLLRAKELLDMKRELESQKEQKRESVIWWRRQRFLWIGMGIVALLGVLGSGCAGLVLWKVNQITQAMERKP